MAKLASAFEDPLGIDTLRGFQRKMEEICAPFLMKQLKERNLLTQQLSRNKEAYASLYPTVLSSVSAAVQIWRTTWQDNITNMPTLGSAFESNMPQYLELQAQLSSSLLKMSAINTAVERERTITQVCTLVGHLTSVVGADEVDSIDLPSELSAEDKQLLADEVSLVSAPEKNWEQRLMERITKLKETHPVLALILSQMILPLLVGILGSLLATAIGQANTPAKVYEKPNAASPIIYHLKPLQQVKVVGEQPYYFQIELPDNDTGETIIGFVSKRSLKVADTEEETFAQN